MISASDIDALNTPLVEVFVESLGKTPGKFRDEQPDVYQDLLAKVSTSYEDVAAKDLGFLYANLAYQLRRHAYGRETFDFVQKSLNCFPFKVSDHGLEGECTENEFLVLTNSLHYQAYAAGLMMGDYKKGHELYDQLDLLMQKLGKFNDIAVVKSAQNKGQIYHRQGMHQSDFYYKAQKCYETTIYMLENSSQLSQAQKDRYSGDVLYCYPKLLTHMAILDEVHKDDLLKRAMDQIEKGFEDSKDTVDFEFDRACMLTVRGSIHAALGDKSSAKQDYEQGLEGQKIYGATFTPRIASTMLKLSEVSNSFEALMLRQEAKLILHGYYGREGHPDFIYYGRKYPEFNHFRAQNHAPELKL